jgi:2-polyprenyl-3-methyl-5-hydroxy-6-metoxy-1,4-benzoquinol methylase
MNTTQDRFKEFKRLQVQAEREVAYDSPDHLVPWGTRQDSSRNRRFNQKLYALMGRQDRPLWIMDMGCSGGGFVKDCLDDGCIAVGIEGSDYSKRLRRAEWRTIPEFLFTADITRPFQVTAEFESGTAPAQFDAITSWEVIEHIADKDLAGVAANVKKHLAPGGLWIMSVSAKPDIINGVNLHQTVQQKPWWLEKFRSLGLEHVEAYINYFNTQYVRGPKYTAEGSFHLVLTADKNKVPPVPNESLLIRIFDTWLGSFPQKLLKRGVMGV